MTIMIPLAVLIRPYRSLCIDSIKGSVSHPTRKSTVPSRRVTGFIPVTSQLNPDYGVWSIMSLVCRHPHSCIFFKMQQPERTHVSRFSAVASQSQPLRWGQAPTQRTTSGTHYHGWLSSPFLRAPSDIPNLLPLCDPATIYRCNVYSCVATRHEPRQTLFLFPSSLLSLLEGISRCDRPSARTVNDSSRRAVV